MHGTVTIEGAEAARRIFRRGIVAQFGFVLDDESARLFDHLAETRGGRSEALRTLVDAALKEWTPPGDSARPPPPSRDADEGESVVVRLTAEEFKLLSEETRRAGMSRGQWAAGCLRRRLRGGRHYNPYDRRSLSEITRSVRRMEALLERYEKALDYSIGRGAPPDQGEQLRWLRQEVARLGTALRASLAGNDAYWDGDPAEELTPARNQS